MSKTFNEWLNEFVENGADPADIENWPTSLKTLQEKIDYVNEKIGSGIVSNLDATFGTNGNYQSSSLDYSHATIKDVNANNSQFKEGYITLAVEKDSIITVYGYGGTRGNNDNTYTSYTVTANGVTSETQTADYSVVAEYGQTIRIDATDTNNYIVEIVVQGFVLNQSITELLTPDTTTNGTYVLQAAVLNGQITYSWVLMDNNNNNNINT